MPDSQAFWDDLLANKTKDGMLTYEMDWMNDQMHQSKSMLTNATLGRTWLMQVDGGARKAHKRSLTWIQGGFYLWCFHTPGHPQNG